MPVLLFSVIIPRDSEKLFPNMYVCIYVEKLFPKSIVPTIFSHLVEPCFVYVSIYFIRANLG